MAAKDAEGTVMVAAEEDEDLPPESEEDALALNAEELKFWVHQVISENIKLEKELEERKAARKMAAEICRTGKPLHLNGGPASQLENGTSSEPGSNLPAKKKRKATVMAAEPTQTYVQQPHLQQAQLQAPQAAVPVSQPPHPLHAAMQHQYASTVAANGNNNSTPPSKEAVRLADEILSAIASQWAAPAAGANGASFG